jgi:hypothetical protein
MGIGALALPLHLPGWDFFSLRFLPMAMCCLVLVLPLEKIESRGGYRVAAGGLVALGLASMLWAVGYNRELGVRSAPALAGLEAKLRRSGARLPMVMDPLLGRPLEDADARVPYAAPLLNLGQIYATEQGGIPAHTFAASRPIHHVLMRDDPVRRFPAYPSRTYPLELLREGAGAGTPLRRKLTTYVASHGVDFEDVILWGLPADAELLLDRGYVADWRRDGLMLAHFEGCPVQLAIETENAGTGETVLPEALVVELGWYPLLESARRYELRLGSPAHEGSARETLRLPLRGAPCGSVWLRVGAAASRPGVPEQEWRCRGSDAEGRLIVRDTRSTPELRCSLAAGSDPALVADRGAAGQALDRHADARGE